MHLLKSGFSQKPFFPLRQLGDGAVIKKKQVLIPKPSDKNKIVSMLKSNTFLLFASKLSVMFRKLLKLFILLQVYFSHSSSGLP